MAFTQKFLMHPRKRLDISWRDILIGYWHAISTKTSYADKFSYPNRDFFKKAYISLSVRTAFDSYLSILNLPKGSEVIMSGMTIQNMQEIVVEHGLIPIPIDIDPNTLAVDIDMLKELITKKTKVIVFAHLFGAQVPLDEMINVAHAHNIIFLEDCAQAFSGNDFLGHDKADASFFSFGSIKTATALGGAVIKVKNSNVLKILQQHEQAYSHQTRASFMYKLFKYSFLKTISNPILYKLFTNACHIFGKNYDTVISMSVRGFSGKNLISHIRHQLHPAQKKFLFYRIKKFPTQKIYRRKVLGSQFAKLLPQNIQIPGNNSFLHTYWIFPIITDYPQKAVKFLRNLGFDASLLSTTLCVIPPPPDKPQAKNLSMMKEKMLYVPMYPEMGDTEIMRLYDSLTEYAGGMSHGNIMITDASRTVKSFPTSVISVLKQDDIINTVRRAEIERKSVSIFGTRHNQAGHGSCTGGYALDMTHYANILSFDRQKKTITVESGCTWEQIQNYINPYGLAIQTMQSSNKFTIGGSLAANIHGRDIRMTCIYESILTFRILGSNGNIRTIDKKSDPSFFHDVIGGYGLFGVILDITLQLTDNLLYKQISRIMDIRDFPTYFSKHILTDPRAHLMIARPCICASAFLSDTIVTTWNEVPDTNGCKDTLQNESNVWRDTFIFGLSRKYAWGKKVRWFLEKYMSLSQPCVSRNNAMRPPVAPLKPFENKSKHHRDCIMEFFIPERNVNLFIDATHNAFIDDKTNLLGITIRYIKKDTQTTLSYARSENAFALMCYINYQKNIPEIYRVHQLSEKLIKIALSLNGTYYLSYHQHAHIDDLHQGYPNIDLFFERKKMADPHELYKTDFYNTYNSASKNM